MKKSIGIIGCSRFGTGLINSLKKFNDIDILAINNNIDIITKTATMVENAFLCDSTKEEALREVGMQNVDEAIIAIGQTTPDGLVNTIITTIMLKRIGVEKITVRLDNPSYETILKTIGATGFINPMKIACEKIANIIAYENIIDYFDVAGQYTIYEIKLQPNFKPIIIKDLALRSKYDMNILLINKNKKSITPNAYIELEPNDEIYIFGENSKINKIVNFFNNYVQD